MDINEYILKLISQALDELEDPEIALSATIRKGIRIAKLRNDYINMWWLEWEMCDLAEEKERSRALATIVRHLSKDQFAYLWKEYQDRWIEERTILHLSQDMKHQSGVFPKSVFNIENEQESSSNTLAGAQTGLFPMELKAKIIFQFNIKSRTEILGRIKQRVFSFLSNTEEQLVSGMTYSDIFERNREYVDSTLSDICPDALKELMAACQTLNKSVPKTFSHALLSCRRALKYLADSLYPARKEPVKGGDGRERSLTEEKYISRLWQYVSDQVGENTSTESLETEIEDVGHRIDRIYALANKGIHADVNALEASQCVTRTYMIIGDILRYREKVQGRQR